MIARTLALALALFVVLALPCAADEFISASDIHFDPYYDPSLMAQLEATDVSGWAAIFASSKITTPSPYGKDTNYPLFQSFLADLKVRAASAKFMTISGDFLCHDFPQNFQLYSSDKSEQAYRSFTTKTVQFIASQIQAAAPNLPVFPTLGNNDSDCGDYEITPNGWFLGVFAKAFAPSIHSKTFVAQFSPTGHYNVPAPMPRTNIIGVNSIFFSTNYDNACGTSGIDYGAQELKWLATQLASAAKAKKRVWLLYHIPPGINVYSTIDGAMGACPTPALMWKSQYLATFDALMKKYASTIVVSLAGHTHMDDFRLMGTTTSPFAYVHITPSISPIFTNNPAYESVSYSPATSTLIDYSVFNLPLGSSPGWGAEYSFGTAYGQPSYTPATIAAMRTTMGSDAAMKAMYMKYYTSSNAASTTITPATFPGYWCGTGTQTGKAFTACYCTPP